jgi:hypothetical protein
MHSRLAIASSGLLFCQRREPPFESVSHSRRTRFTVSRRAKDSSSKNLMSSGGLVWLQNNPQNCQSCSMNFIRSLTRIRKQREPFFTLGMRPLASHESNVRRWTPSISAASFLRTSNLAGDAELDCMSEPMAGRRMTCNCFPVEIFRLCKCFFYRMRGALHCADIHLFRVTRRRNSRPCTCHSTLPPSIAGMR